MDGGSRVLGGLKDILPRLIKLETLVLEYDEYSQDTMKNWSLLANLMPSSLKSLVMVAPDRMIDYVSSVTLYKA